MKKVCIIVSVFFLLTACVSKPKSPSVDDKDFSVDGNGDTPLMQAVLQGDEAAVDRELPDRQSGEKGSLYLNTVNKNGDSALHLAIKGENERIITMLLSAIGTDRTLRDAEGNTPLLLAVKNGVFIAVQLLLDDPAYDVRITDKNGLAALAAALHGAGSGRAINTIVVDRLLRRGLRFDSAYNPVTGQNYLIDLCADGRTDIIELYLKYDNQLAAKQTPDHIPLLLQGIAEGWAPQIIELLIAYYPPWDTLIDRKGQSAGDYTKTYKRERMYATILGENR
jgi:ankyrin repeat protein